MSAAVAFRTSINEYLEQLPPTTTARLYSRPATCLAIFRLLPALARQYVMMMLYTATPVGPAVFDSWASAGGRNRQGLAHEKLLHLNVIRIQKDGLVLNDAFRKNMQLALTGGGTHRSFGVPAERTKAERPDVAFLDSWCIRTWEDILHFMVGTTSAKTPGRSVVQLLESGGLWDQEHGITSAGFQFLLQDGNAQIWTLLLQYLELSDTRGADPVEITHFLFMLGYLELGQDYSTADLSQEQLHLLRDLVDFGIVYQQRDDKARFYPTRLATTLVHDATSQSAVLMPGTTDAAVPAGGASAGATATDSNFVILETNYKLYAYTSSALQIAVLNLFCRLTARFPNMVCGALTRESIREALKKGITADQIVLYLGTHAHPQMRRSQGPLLPPTVVDQIRLWELEKDRLKATSGYLFRDFRILAEYEAALQYARDIGVLIYENPGRRMFFTSDAGQTAVANYVRRQSERRVQAKEAAAAAALAGDKGEVVPKEED